MYVDMLIYPSIQEQTMTFSSRKTTTLTDDEWNEMNALRKVITERPQSLVPEKMEKFTELFIKSLYGADDSHPLTRS